MNFKPFQRIRFSAAFVFAAAALLFSVNVVYAQDALHGYVTSPDVSFAWKHRDEKRSGEFLVSTIHLTSQTWREHPWQHTLLLVQPGTLRHPDIAFLLIAGSEPPESHLQTLKTLAQQAGAIAAVLSDVPNQPLYDGRVEDALIAYTFDQFLRTGDSTWPLLFPMVKSAVRACDAISAFSRERSGSAVNQFVLSGASKRGWTTWLAAAVDSRVVGIVPMVFDMLNMKAQTEWARKVYGQQSERIHDYTDAGLIQRMDEPRAVQLREWIDPYHYRKRFTMPKLLLLGTNDPYWTVDSMRHYWADLPEPKHVYQTPNAGHSLGEGAAINALAAFFETIAMGQQLPRLNWSVETGATNVTIQLQAEAPLKNARLWMAESPDRDFRNDHWEPHPVKHGKQPGSAGVSIVVPPEGYRAFLMEADFVSPGGHPYKLSTQATVVPDTIRP